MSASYYDPYGLPNQQQTAPNQPYGTPSSHQFPGTPPYQQADPLGGPPQPPWSKDNRSKTQLTREEMIIIKECQSESFWRRSLPFSILASFGVSAGYKYGFIQNKRLRLLYYASAITGGYVVGKMSYIGPCLKKLKTLKHSPLADALSRKDRQAEVFQDMSQLPGLSGTPEIKRDDGSYQSYEGGDIYHNPDFTSQGQSPATLLESEQNPKYATSYDELRRKNREEYWYKQRNVPGAPPAVGTYQQPYSGPQPIGGQGQQRQDRSSLAAPQSDSGAQRPQGTPNLPDYGGPSSGPSAYRTTVDQSNVIESDARYPKSNSRKYDDRDFS